MYTAEQISELIQALLDAENNSELDCEIHELRPVLRQAADALTALTADISRLKVIIEAQRNGLINVNGNLERLTAENEALTHERDKLSKLLKAECAISNSHNDTIARLQAELAARRAKYEPVCPSCGLQNNRLVHNRYCDRCWTNMTIAAPEV